MNYNFSDFYWLIAIGWFASYVSVVFIGGILSIFFNKIAHDNDITVKIRRIND